MLDFLITYLLMVELVMKLVLTPDSEINTGVSNALVKVLVLLLELMNGTTNTLRPWSRHTTHKVHRRVDL
jgi:hypothetical protein